jgi:hypothetical protein
MEMGGQSYALAALYPQEKPGTHCSGGWMGPRAVLGRLGKSRHPTGIRSLDRPAGSESLCRLSYPGILRYVPYTTLCHYLRKIEKGIFVVK